MPQISVIVPVYNVEKYLHRCVDSILAQTFSDFELILVDDGSPDNCGKICDDYMDKDNRVKVIHKENGGVSAARNDALDIVQGEYIIFADSDDWVTDKYLEDFMHCDADLICQTSFVMKDGNNESKYVDKKEFSFDNCSRDNIITMLLCHSFNGMLAKRLKTSVIKQHNVRFVSSIDFAEDTMFIIEYTKYIKSIRVENIANYCYMKYSDHATLSGHYSKKRLDVLKKANNAICDILELNDEERENVFLTRMRDPYQSYIDEHFSFRLRKLGEAMKTLFELSEDDVFCSQLKKGFSYSLPSRIYDAILKKSKVELFAAYIKSQIIIRYGKKLEKNPLYHTYLLLKSCNVDRRLHLTSGINHKEKRSPHMIVSLTSFPARIPYVDKAIRSLLNQTFKPDMLILWLAEPQFPNKEKDLPWKLKRLCRHGLTIKWVKDDIKSYKKLIPALLEYPNDIIVTFDDDMYVSRTKLEKLYQSYLNHPNEIQCHAITRIEKSENGFDSAERELKYIDTSSYHNKVLGGAGCLYPPRSLYSDVVNEKLFMSLAPTSDDIWFWGMALKQGTKVRWVENPDYEFIYIEDTQTKTPTLWSINDRGERNFYKHLNAVIDAYELQPLLS